MDTLEIAKKRNAEFKNISKKILENYLPVLDKDKLNLSQIENMLYVCAIEAYYAGIFEIKNIK